MLSAEIIKILCDVANIKLIFNDNIPTGYVVKELMYPKRINSIDIELIKESGQSSSRITDEFYKIPYDLVKNAIGEDIRFHWLLTENLYLAGGSVLNWIWGENKNEDFDFFLTQENIDFALLSFIKDIGFIKVNSTGYADTYSNAENTLVQIVRLSYGEPQIILDKFDINACKFAVSSDFLYVNRKAIIDLLSLTISPGKASFHPVLTLDRYLKYNRKGFFMDKSILDGLTFKPNTIEWFTNDIK